MSGNGAARPDVQKARGPGPHGPEGMFLMEGGNWPEGADRTDPRRQKRRRTEGEPQVMYAGGGAEPNQGPQGPGTTADGQPQLWQDLMSAASDEIGSMDGHPLQPGQQLGPNGIPFAYMPRGPAPGARPEDTANPANGAYPVQTNPQGGLPRPIAAQRPNPMAPQASAPGGLKGSGRPGLAAYPHGAQNFAIGAQPEGGHVMQARPPVGYQIHPSHAAARPNYPTMAAHHPAQPTTDPTGEAAPAHDPTAGAHATAIVPLDAAGADAGAAMVQAPAGGADPEGAATVALVTSQPGTKQEVWEGGQLVAAGAIAPTGPSGYPIAGPAQGPLGQYPQYPVAPAHPFLAYPSAVQTLTNYRAVVVPATTEVMRQSVDSRTRVRCEPGTLGGRDEIVTSQKLWQKYGEKQVQHARDKSADRSQPVKLKKRSYFKCYNKSCPAKMIVDVDAETGEEMVPFLSGAHSHTFEIAPTDVET